MGAIASQITGVFIVCSTVGSGADQRKIKALYRWPLWGNSPVTGEFPAQTASDAENVSIWWRHHYYTDFDLSSGINRAAVRHSFIW